MISDRLREQQISSRNECEPDEFDTSASDTSMSLSANRSVNKPITLNAAASGMLSSSLADIIFHVLSDGSIFVEYVAALCKVAGS